MGFHTFDAEKAEKLEDDSRYRYVSREELVGSLDPSDDDVVADLGSGTGFYTDDVAPHVEQLYAVDVQEPMHDQYRKKGVPENVSLVTANVAELPFDDGELDGAFSTMTFHEFAGEDALAEVARVLADGGRLVVADWSGKGIGESGPPVDERFDVDEASEQLVDAGFTVEHGYERPETFFLVARR
ncbi:class I SAM-dependent methyltransferase [Halomicrococcus gelatinilyticus]|uniref:class I SAM-dependent methyltransferase n=1 Tax=Halomicrococcus gelatinilyticus TaxID=1702103 RepID=UPI002E0F0485